MKKISLVIVFALSFMLSHANVTLSSIKGVWASNNAEAVITDSVCILFAQIDSTMQATLEIPSAGICHQTVFQKNGEVTTSHLTGPLEIKAVDDAIEICGNRLKKIEDIEIVAPYDMSECKNKLDVEKCLQEWRLGAQYGIQGDMPYCEINTNRHMFVYLVNPSMVYIRAAATRNNCNGTLFFQNIRMMKNNNTGEYTMSILPNNFSFTKNDIEIDNSKFNPNACTFDTNGGIYWSLISYTPDMILLNGCGETYQVARPEINAPLNEWIKYNPYNDNPDFSISRMIE